MRLYEGMFIISDSVAGADWEAAVKHVEDLLKNRGAEILKSEKWEDRKFYNSRFVICRSKKRSFE